MKNLLRGQVLLLLTIIFSLCFIPDMDAQRQEVMKLCGNNLGGCCPPPGYEPPPPPPCGVDFYPVTLDENCKGYIYPQIYMVNIESSPIYKNYYALPEYLAPLYARHEISPGNWLVSGPYTVAVYVGKKDFADEVTRDDFYVIQLQLEVEETRNICLSENMFYNDIRRVEIVTPDTIEGGYKLYPIHSYSDTTEVFSCNAFRDTWCDCHRTLPPPDIYNACDTTTSSEPIYDLSVCFTCGDCFVEIEDREGHIDEADLQLQITPNPMAENLNFYTWIPQPGEISYSLYDTKGQLMIQGQEVVQKGFVNKTFSVADLSPGIYYFHFQQGNRQSIQKLLKY